MDISTYTILSFKLLQLQLNINNENNWYQLYKSNLTYLRTLDIYRHCCHHSIDDIDLHKYMPHHHVIAHFEILNMKLLKTHYYNSPLTLFQLASNACRTYNMKKARIYRKLCGKTQ